MSRLVESTPGPSRFPESSHADERKKWNVGCPADSCDPVSALVSGYSSKLYAKGHLEIFVERVDSQLHYPSRFKKRPWSTVVATLRGNTLKVVPTDNTKYSEEFNISGAIVEKVTTGISKEAAFRLILTTSFANISLIFACASYERLNQWIAAVLWSDWERTRVDEIFTALILKQVVCEKGTVEAQRLGKAPTTLTNGVLEGYVYVQIGGQPSDGSSFWLTVGHPNPESSPVHYSRNSNVHNPAGAALNFYLSHKGKDQKGPILKVSKVTQAYVARDRWGDSPNRRGCIMLYGFISGFGERGANRSDTASENEGWLSIEPDESPHGSYHNILDWLIAVHDAFGLYGRPTGWIWDPTNPHSLDFGLTTYPPGRSVLVPKRLVDSLVLPDPLLRENVRPQFEAMLLTRVTEIVFSDVPASDSGTLEYHDNDSDASPAKNTLLDPFMDFLAAPAPKSSPLDGSPGFPSRNHAENDASRESFDSLQSAENTCTQRSSQCSTLAFSPPDGSTLVAKFSLEDGRITSPPPGYTTSDPAAESIAPSPSLEGHSDYFSVYRLTD